MGYLGWAAKETTALKCKHPLYNTTRKGRNLTINRSLLSRYAMENKRNVAIKEEDCKWESVQHKMMNYGTEEEEDCKWEQVVFKEESEQTYEATEQQNSETVNHIKAENFKPESATKSVHLDEKVTGTDCTKGGPGFPQSHSVQVKTEILDSEKALCSRYSGEDLQQSGTVSSTLFTQTSALCKPQKNEEMNNFTVGSDVLILTSSCSSAALYSYEDQLKIAEQKSMTKQKRSDKIQRPYCSGCGKLFSSNNNNNNK
ncbi:uncharacterized protein LOC127527729 [Erpetoichthys calabaricus]|uniref:uncharacterized protein LOC127527729 n=1 Tax=Erpetoichthys calabaricus TaxID=27687 RepID=UPI0022349B5F|nr:uncharacterized protein LOC127527729 [Erpetoichthys calabaricus]